MKKIKLWGTSALAILIATTPTLAQVTAIGAGEGQVNIVAWAGYIERGETVKALIVLKPPQRGQVTEQELIDWSRERMAAYKVPRLIEFVEHLPKSGTGKILWRELQAQHRTPGAPQGA